MKRLFILLAAAFLANTALAQGVKIMQVIKNNAVAFEIPVSEIDSIFFKTVDITSDEGVVINGIRWATRNVDAPGTFALTPESYGMLYQWQNNVGWSSTNPLVDSNGGTVWRHLAAGQTPWVSWIDPCPTGWRVPNVSDFLQLFQAPHGVVELNGVRGLKITGTDGVIFLPYAPTRSGNNLSYGVITYHTRDTDWWPANWHQGRRQWIAPFSINFNQPYRIGLDPWITTDGWGTWIWSFGNGFSTQTATQTANIARAVRCVAIN